MKQCTPARVVVNLLLFCCAMTVSAQQSYEFQQLAHRLHDGAAMQVSYRNDGVVFVANRQDGLRTFKYQDSHFVSISHVKEENEGALAADVTLGSDGTIFLANFQDGLRAYKFNNNVFEMVAHVDDGGEAETVVVREDGMVFLANGADGLRVYQYSEQTFSPVAHFNDLPNYHEVRKVAVKDTLVILGIGDGYGLMSLTFDGLTFTQTDTVSNESGVSDIEITQEGIIYVAGRDAGLQAYTYAGNSMTETASVTHSHEYLDYRCTAVTIGSDGTVFAAIGVGGIKAYSYTGSSFVLLDEINSEWPNETGPIGLVFGADSTLFAACANDGLYAYGYKNDALGFVASINEGGYVYWGTTAPYEISTHPSGLIASVNAYDGVRLSRFENNNFWNVAHLNDFDPFNNYAKNVLISSDEKVFLSTADGIIRAYEVIGHQYVNTATINSGNAGNYSTWLSCLVEWSQDTLIQAKVGSGLAAYSYKNETFNLITEKVSGGTAASINVDSNGNVFLADGEEGLKVYRFNGSSFNLITSINDGGTAWSVTTSDDGLVYVSFYDDGLKIYSFDGASISLLAHWGSPRAIFDTEIGSNGLIYTAFADTTGSTGGLEALSLTGNVVTKLAEVTMDTPSYSLALGSNDVVYSANGTQGMFAWELLNTTEVNEDRQEIPIFFRLNQNYPNPFNPNTTISYELPVAVDVTLHIYDINGREIKTLVNTHQQAGQYSTRWNGKSNSGLAVETGLYFARIQAGDDSNVIKMVYLK